MQKISKIEKHTAQIRPLLHYKGDTAHILEKLPVSILSRNRATFAFIIHSHVRSALVFTS